MAAALDPSGRFPAVFTNAGDLLVHRLPRPAPRPTCCPGGGRCRPVRRRRRPARHHDRRDRDRRRRGDGRRPAGHHGQPHRQPRHREGARGRRVLAGRHRRHRRGRHRDDPAVPGRARALREDRGHHALPRRQGQPAGHDDPQQPRRGPAGPRRRSRCSPASTSTRRPGRGPAASSASTSPAASTRRPGTTASAPVRCSRSRRSRSGTGRGSRPRRRSRLAVEALYDAADDDTATGGPDLTRRIFPVVMTATADGTRRLTDDEAAAVAEAVVAGRMENPGG